MKHDSCCELSFNRQRFDTNERRAAGTAEVQSSGRFARRQTDTSEP